MAERPRPSIAFVYHGDELNGDSPLVSGLKVFRRVADDTLDFNPLTIQRGGLQKGKLDKTFPEAQEQQRRGLLTMIVTHRSDYTGPLYANADTIDPLRQVVGHEIPVYVLDDQSPETPINAGNNIFIANPHSTVLLDQMRQLIANTSGLPQALRRYAAPEAEALRRAYRKNFPDADGLDSNTQTVLAYLRWNYLPSDIVKEEYDGYHDAYVSREHITRSPEEVTFLRDVQLLKNMNDSERAELKDKAYDMSNEDDYYNRVFGYAIDPVTLTSEISFGVGLHSNAALNLARYLIADGRTRGERLSELAYAKRILTGVIWEPIAPFKTSFVQLGGIVARDPVLTSAEMGRIGVHILQQRQFIPVTPYIELIDKDSSYTTPLRRP